MTPSSNDTHTMGATMRIARRGLERDERSVETEWVGIATAVVSDPFELSVPVNDGERLYNFPSR